MSGKPVWVVGTDIGGTFTDVIGVNLETGEQRIGKVPSTPPTFFDGVINGLRRAGLRGEETLSFRHDAFYGLDQCYSRTQRRQDRPDHDRRVSGRAWRRPGRADLRV